MGLASEYATKLLAAEEALDDGDVSSNAALAIARDVDPLLGNGGDDDEPLCVDSSLALYLVLRSTLLQLAESKSSSAAAAAAAAAAPVRPIFSIRYHFTGGLMYPGACYKSISGPMGTPCDLASQVQALTHFVGRLVVTPADANVVSVIVFAGVPAWGAYAARMAGYADTAAAATATTTTMVGDDTTDGDVATTPAERPPQEQPLLSTMPTHKPCKYALCTGFFVGKDIGNIYLFAENEWQKWSLDSIWHMLRDGGKELMTYEVLTWPPGLKAAPPSAGKDPTYAPMCKVAEESIWTLERARFSDDEWQAKIADACAAADKTTDTTGACAAKNLLFPGGGMCSRVTEPIPHYQKTPSHVPLDQGDVLEPLGIIQVGVGLVIGRD